MNGAYEVGKKLCLIRESRGLTQNQVVEQLALQGISLSRETLSKIENGNRSISAVELNTLCKIFDVEIKSLFDQSEPDDLVTLFRRKKVSETAIEEIEVLQEMIKLFISQKDILNSSKSKPTVKPMWEEC